VNLKEVYRKILKFDISDNDKWFIRKVLDNPNIDKKPNAYNYGVNDGCEAGRTLDHFHLHIIPRYSGDVDDPCGGVRHVIPGMGNYRIKRGG